GWGRQTWRRVRREVCGFRAAAKQMKMSTARCCVDELHTHSEKAVNQSARDRHSTGVPIELVRFWHKAPGRHFRYLHRKLDLRRKRSLLARRRVEELRRREGLTCEARQAHRPLKLKHFVDPHSD